MSLDLDYQTNTTNRMLLGSSLTSNRSNFIGCAHAWAYDSRKSHPHKPTPVGKCFIINNRGEALNSFEPVIGNKISRISFTRNTHKTEIIKRGRPLHSHMMSGFSATFANVMLSLHNFSTFYKIIKKTSFE